MKRLIQRALIGLVLMNFSLISCQKGNTIKRDPITENGKPRYSTIEEFRQGIAQVVNQIQQQQIVAYLDTLPDGYPDINGRKIPLQNLGYGILENLQGNEEQIASAVYDVFHFDEATFSLISFLMKAQMVSDISAQMLADILAKIPLPPIPAVGFAAPTKVDLPILIGDCCTDNTCVPKIDILVTWSYKPPCGNYEKKLSGYAANNTLTNMSRGKMYRFDAVISGCPCPGVLTSTVTAPAGASYGAGKGKDGSVTLIAESGGTYTVTFTFTVCSQVVTKTFTLGVK